MLEKGLGKAEEVVVEARRRQLNWKIGGRRERVGLVLKQKFARFDED